MDYKVPDLHEAAGEAGEYHIQHPVNQHWRPPGFMDDTTVIGHIREGEESAYRREVEQLAIWCGFIRKKAQERMYYLCQLRKSNLPQELLIQFYTAIIQSVLCSSITVWFGSATKQDRNRLQQTVRTAERVIGTSLPSVQDLYESRVRKWARSISADPSHHGLPSCRRYRALYITIRRHRNSFFPQAVTLMNT
ncbi:hypothetical protein D4764_07G0000840 [Takifugu flavidus]|uniref:Alkylated DNA repair protein AlkB homologue 8 N-terminal domain-containing protein n=1 Tax=Takifugu flavidus TaxID=433684 RepID=A0A5C6MRE3_9TELE|nr:hypothetical protein D4764_07G0000840 [Takifugu flavidus]